MIEVHIYIPESDNSGNAYSPAHHSTFELLLCAEFNGCSLQPGRVEGRWMSSGVLYLDNSRVYIVALSSITHGGRVKTATDFAKGHYGQLAIYVRYLGLSEIL